LKSTLARQFLSYFLGFYLFVLALLLIGLNLDNSPQRLLTVRTSTAQVDIAFERILHDQDLAVASGAQPAGPLVHPELQRSFGFGRRTLVYEFEPQHLVDRLQKSLAPVGISVLGLCDLHGRMLAVGSSSRRRPIPVTLSPLPLQLLVGAPSFRFQFPDPPRAAVLICAILLLPFLASQVFARRVTRPLRSLQDASEKLASGSLDHRIVSTGQDEIGHLAHTFNRMAEQLQAKNLHLEEINRLKSLFLASVSHELRTPLTAIFGQTQMLRDGLKGPLTEAQDATVQKVQRNAASLLSLITDLLDMAKIEAGQMDVHLEEFELKECVAAAVDAVELKPALELVVNCPPNLWALADFDRTRQILVNLLSNAIKFTEAGSVSVTVTVAEGWLQVDVRDTGVGIRPEELELVFAEFRQVGKAQAGGTGLGLAISRKLAELQHSRLGLASEFGVGSTFTLKLPVAPALEGRVP
jgi:signal transduction histidine kinase